MTATNFYVPITHLELKKAFIAFARECKFTVTRVCTLECAKYFSVSLNAFNITVTNETAQLPCTRLNVDAAMCCIQDYKTPITCVTTPEGVILPVVKTPTGIRIGCIDIPTATLLFIADAVPKIKTKNTLPLVDHLENIKNTSNCTYSKLIKEISYYFTNFSTPEACNQLITYLHGVLCPKD
jgi:hypothetical protein